MFYIIFNKIKTNRFGTFAIALMNTLLVTFISQYIFESTLYS